MITELFAPLTRRLARTRPSPEALEREPRTAERTGAQSGRSDVVGQMVSGGATQMPSASVRTYKAMRRNPTIALARLIVTAPIKSVAWSVESDDGADERHAWVEDTLLPILPLLVQDACRALDFGAQHWELVWAMRDGRWLIEKAKALEVELTEVLVDQATGAYAGLAQGKVEIRPPVSLSFVNDADPGDYLGQSRHEAARPTWARWNTLQTRLDTYAVTAAAAVPIVEYPVGQGYDASGASQDNYDLAVSVLAELGRAKGVAMPNTLAPYAEDLMRSGMDPSKLRAWHIDFLASGGNGGDQLTGIGRYYESLMMRAWLVPERAGIEGQHGTKAEAATHTEVVADGADLFLTDLARVLNWYVVDPLLALNWGAAARGSVRLAPAAVNDAVKLMLQTIVEKVLTNPVSLDLFADVIDWDQALDRTGVPRTGDFEPDAAAQAAAKAQAGPGGAVLEDLPGGGGGGALPANIDVEAGERLNGAQIQAAKDVIADVISGQMPPAVAIDLLVSVGLSLERAKAMVSQAAAFKPSPAAG